MQTIKENLIFKVEQAEPILSGDYSGDDLIRVMYELSNYCRMLGIAYLLGDADRDNYFKYLMLSAQNRKKMLTLQSEKKMKPNRFTCSSVIMPLFDSLVGCEDLSLPKEIIDLSLNSWIEDEEYEEDYCYSMLIHSLVLNENETIQIELLNKYLTSLKNKESIRYSLCKAIIETESTCFYEHFLELIEEHENKYAEESKYLIVQPEKFDTERYIFIEGLAILRIAQCSGISTENEFKYCPSIAMR